MLALGVSTFVHAQDVVIGDSLTIGMDTLKKVDREKYQRIKRVTKKVKHTGSLLYRFVKSFDDYDTTYISPNYYNYTAMLQNTNTFQLYRMQGRNEEGNVQTIVSNPQHQVKVGPYFGWRWIFLGYTFDVLRPKSAGKASSFNLSLYSSMLGCDFLHFRNNGNYLLRKVNGFEGVEPTSVRGIPFSGLSTKTTSFSAYYVFNHRHFSYPAAFNQSTVQRKSCGSPMLGLGFSKQHNRFDYTKLPENVRGSESDEKIIEELKFSEINYNYYYVSAGYAYNWVFARNFLLGFSAMPSVGYRKTKGEKIKGNEVLIDLKNFSFDCTSRFGLVWNNTHWFVGSSLICNLYVYNKNKLNQTNAVTFVNIYAGFFFNRKKMYKRKK